MNFQVKKIDVLERGKFLLIYLSIFLIFLVYSIM